MFFMRRSPRAVFSHGLSSSFVLFVVFIATTVMSFLGKQQKQWQTVLSRVVLLFADVMLVVAIVSAVYTFHWAKTAVYDQYMKGNYSVVEGTIENYTEIPNIAGNLDGGVKYDHFDVNGVLFNVPSMMSWGYSLTQYDGGVLKDGLNVKISYIFFRFENIMMKVELV